MISINKNAMRVVHEILEDPEALGCKAIRMNCGVTLIDMGLNTKGSWQAGLLFARATIGNLGMVSFGNYKVNDRYSFSSVEVFVDQPMIACMGSQIAGWKLGEGDFAAIGSGPARALAVVETDRYFKMTPYRDRHDEAVLCIQSNAYPSEEIASYVAQACHVKPNNTYLLITSNVSAVCSIQVSARVIEQVCHKMFEKGFDPAQIALGRGRAPIAPVCNDPIKTMGRMNDAILYGGETELWVDSEDALIAKTIHQLTSNTSSPDYGELFMDIFERSGRDFYRMDYDVHSIAKIQIHNIRTGKAFSAGEINFGLLEESFLR